VSVNRILYIGQSALYAYRVGLDVTSHNIANADTQDYTRQEVIMGEALPEDYSRVGRLGRGVVVQQIRAMRADNLLGDYQEELASQADFQTRRPLLSQIEGFLNPDEDFGLTAILERFWDSWEDLANNPEGEAQRLAVLSEGETLSSFIRSVKSDLNLMGKDIEANYKTAVNRINELSQDLAEVNQQIRDAEAVGHETNAFRDLRDGYLRELADYVGTTSFHDPDGTMTVLLANGKPLVQGVDYFTLTLDSTFPREVRWSGDNSDVVSGLTGGKLGAWAEIRESVIPQFEDNLDELAQGLIWEVNRLHSQGVGLAPFTSVTSSYQVRNLYDGSDPRSSLDPADIPLASQESGLAFYDQIEDSGYFKVFVYDSDGNAVSHRVEVTDQTTLGDLAGQLGAIDNLNATITDGRLSLSTDSGFSFNFGEVTEYESETEPYGVNSSILAALGLNTFFHGQDADSIEVNQVVLNDHTKIAAGFIAGVEEDGTPPVNGKTGEYSPGDNRNALAIGLLRQTRVSLDLTTYTLSGGATTSTSEATLGEFLGTIVSQIGVLGNEASVNEDFHTMMANQLDSLIKEQSAVNLDEELINMLKYQRAYQAAARIITTGDELLQTLMQI